MFRAGPHLTVCIFSLLSALFLVPARAAGQSSALTEAVDTLNASQGPEAHTHVRAVWQRWADTDPVWVEQALRDASVSTTLPRTGRDYASFLLAQAHLRRGDVAGARRAIAELGYVGRWLVLGPFDNEGKAGFSTEFGPETHFNEALSEGRTYSGKERAVHWRVAPDAFDLGWLNGASLFRPEVHVCFFASTFVHNQATKARRVELFAGAAGAFQLYLNGKEVLSDLAYRGHDVDRRGSEVEMPSGVNNVTAKVCNADSAPVLSLRVVPSDGERATLTVSATFADSESAVKNHGKGRVTKGGLGPLSEFERLVGRKGATAADFEAFARYLVQTHGDDPTTHSARDYARRAAELAPTVERQLLAGETAEDYNQHRSWVERAEALAAKSGNRSVGLALARATVEKGGLSWRDAFAHYLEARRRAPDNIDAIRGHVELLNEAGLQFTALEELETALTRNPNAVTLLNLQASQLRALGRTQDAEEVELRYAQFRFDDNSFISQKLDLALARDNRASAEHWIARLLELNPDSLWAHSTAALAYRRLAQPERAIQNYERALALAPDDVTVLRSLADLRGELGQRDEQIALMQRILELQPQAKEVEEYLAHVEPEAPKRDEALAWKPDRFMERAAEPAGGESRRTLLDLTVTTVFENGLSSQFRQVVFQPLVDSAAALSQSYSFQFQADTQRVRLRGARVFRSDGSVDEAIETGVSAANDTSIAMYTSARTYNVQFPRLDPGDVVELRYRVDDVTSRNEFDDYFGDIQYLQSNEYVSHAEWVLFTPEKRNFYVDDRGVPGLKKETRVENGQRIFRFFADNVPPVEAEPAMPSWQEVLGFVHVSTYANYDELGKWYWGLVQDQFDLDDETRKLAREITAGLTTEREKVAAVYNWVIKNTRYVALEFGIYGFKPRRCVQTVSRGWGDCKDKATVIVSLLEELGIDSTIVILRTQMRGGFESKVASLAPFDHAIAYVPSLDLYLDGTAEFTGSTELPEMDQGSLGILVNRGKPQVVKLPNTTPERTVRSRTLAATVDADGSATLDMSFEVKGTQAPSWRRRYNAAGTRRERVVADLSHEFPGLTLLPDEQGLKVSLDDFEAPVRVDVAGKSPSYARLEGGDLSVPVTTRTRLLDEFGTLSKRKLDVKLGAFGSVEDHITVTLPPGYRIKSTPSEAKVETRFGAFSVKVEQSPKSVTVHSRIAVNVAKVTPAEYAAWRTFCQAVDNAMNARLVVGK
jgi:cellulose synthase operon protein C